MRNSDGTISIASFEGPNGQLLKYKQIDPLFYREVNGRSHLAFKRDGDGQMQFQSKEPDIVFQKVGFWENKNFNYTNLIFSFGVIILTVAAVASRSAGSQTLWPSAGSKSAGAQAAACGAVGLPALHQFLPGLGWCFRVGPRGFHHVDDCGRSLDSVFWSTRCDMCSRHDCRLRECIPELEDSQQMDMGEAARYSVSAFLRGPDAVFDHLETHELQFALLSRQ